MLRLQPHSPLAAAHCVLQPIEQVDSHAGATEEVAAEVRNFKKCLIRMGEAAGEQRAQRG